MGATLGLKLNEDWLVKNSVIYVQNYFLRALAEERASFLLSALRSLFDMLKQTKYTADDGALFCELAFNVARTLELQAKASSAMSDDCKAALDVCAAAATVGTAMERKRILWTRARIQKAAGQPPTLDGDETAQLLSLAELMRLEQADGKGASEHLKKVPPLVEKCPDNPELFTRLAQLALGFNDRRLSIELARKVIDALPEGVGILPRVRRWLALAESLFGQALMALLDPDKHERPVQDSLRQQSAAHFVKCARHAAMLSLWPLVLQASQRWWNAMLPFMGSAVTREVLAESLGELVEITMQMEPTFEAEFRLKLLILLLESLSDRKQWKEALAASDLGLSRLPSGVCNSIWEMRVGIVGALGRSAAGDLSQMKDVTPEVQAKVLLTLARSAQKPEQLAAYQSALDSLAKSGTSSKLATAEVHIEFAQWLFENKFPIEDAQDQLLNAADLLGELDPSLGEFAHSAADRSPTQACAPHAAQAV